MKSHISFCHVCNKIFRRNCDLRRHCASSTDANGSASSNTTGPGSSASHENVSPQSLTHEADRPESVIKHILGRNDSKCGLENDDEGFIDVESD